MERSGAARGQQPRQRIVIRRGVNVAIFRPATRECESPEDRAVPWQKVHAGYHVTLYHPTPVSIHRAKTVIVPNIGGFAGASWRIQNFKVSAGYRADLFFGAMDGGIDAAKKENVGFYGPFASVSIGQSSRPYGAGRSFARLADRRRLRSGRFRAANVSVRLGVWK